MAVKTLSNSTLKCITGLSKITAYIENNIGNQLIKCNLTYETLENYENNVVTGGLPFVNYPESNYRNIISNLKNVS